MNTIKNKLFYFCFVITLGCSTIKKKDTLKYDICEKFIVKSDPRYEGENEKIKQIFNDYNSKNNNKVDVIRKLTINGYDLKETVKRVYIDNGVLYIYDNGKLLKKEKVDLTKFNTLLKNHNKSNIYVSCNRNSSLKYNYRMYIKIDNVLVATFYSNNIIDNIDPLIINDEINFIKYFEDLGNGTD